MRKIGLPDSQECTPVNGSKKTVKLISNQFFQRVFTRRKRNGNPEKVGTAPHQYVVRESGESSTMTSMYDGTVNVPVSRSAPPEISMRQHWPQPSRQP
ncbi:DUF3274 domain-containing protein [Paraburkholderia sp. J69-1]|uniref:effector protein Tle3 domain-containing protein n=1 Tax=unclassified Paraburkholderia TaxID=2615204 RepID=UPI0039EE7BA2